MDPLELVDEVVEDWWESHIYDVLEKSPYDSFCNIENSRVMLLSPKDVLDLRWHVYDMPEMRVEDFFDFNDAFDAHGIKPYTETDLGSDLECREPVWSAIKALENTPKDTNWEKMVCDLTFFGCNSVEKSNTYEESDSFTGIFDLIFSELCMDIARELTFIDKPLVEYTDCPLKKIWSKITVDGVPLLRWLEVA